MAGDVKVLFGDGRWLGREINYKQICKQINNKEQVHAQWPPRWWLDSGTLSRSSHVTASTPVRMRGSQPLQPARFPDTSELPPACWASSKRARSPTSSALGTRLRELPRCGLQLTQEENLQTQNPLRTLSLHLRHRIHCGPYPFTSGSLRAPSHTSKCSSPPSSLHRFHRIIPGNILS